MAFNPKQHVIKIKGKLYLKAAPRMQWFRDDHPNGRIITDMLNIEPAICRAEVYDTDGTLLATGLGMAIDKGNTTWSGRAIEKAETAAIARALKHAGYGTEFALDETDDDANHLADSPVSANGKQPQPQPQEQAQHVEWTAEDKANFSMALSKRFPNTHASVMLASMKKKSLSELGTITQAANAAIEWSYSNEQPFIADVVRYVSDGKNSFMVFRADDDPDSKHIAVRAYGRSTTVKSWLGGYAYDALEFGTIHETPNEWIPLKRSLTIFYDAKQKEDGSTYYVANGIGHGIEDPDEVDF